MNEPPADGSCSFSPQTIEQGEPVYFECKDWVDPDWPDENTIGIQSYEISGNILSHTKNNKTIKIVFKATDTLTGANEIKASTLAFDPTNLPTIQA